MKLTDMTEVLAQHVKDCTFTQAPPAKDDADDEWDDEDSADTNA